jgi:glycosyltransferase involved in cell wall biosynthesis
MMGSMKNDETIDDHSQTRQPLVSVIITNYNYADYLKQAIDSTLAQTYSNLEVIVVDDGSKDDSQKVITRYGDRVIPVFKANGGQASGFNAGFAASRGALICFLDADDLWMPSKVEALVQASLSKPEAVLLYHKMQWIDNKEVPYGKPWPFTLWQGQIADRVVSSGGWWRHPPTSGLCCKRSFLEQIMPIPREEYRQGGDAYIASLAPLLGEIVGIDEVLALYRIHGANDHLSWDSNIQCSFFENHVRCLNETLARVGAVQRLSLEDHWFYQYYKWKLGEGYGPFQLSWKALHNPTAHPISRIKSLTMLWREALGAKKTQTTTILLEKT